MTRHLASLLLLILLIPTTACRRAEQKQQTFDAPVIVISIDTLRADRLPAYGSTRVATPAIDAFRRDAILFENAWSHCPMTLPSHVSILTGKLPYENGVRNNLGYTFDASRHVTIPSMLKGRGYATGAAVSAYVLRGATGLAKAFDDYDDAIVATPNVSIADLSRAGGDTAAVAQRWIASRGDKPFFYLLHIFEPHAPYDPPAAMRQRYPDPYDGEVAASDEIIGRFLDSLRSSGIYDRAAIVLLSDHGEGLGDHGEGEHGVFLYRETMRVPLLVKLPAGVRAGTTVTRPVQLIDLLPTIAKLTGATPPAGLRGMSLLDDVAKPEAIYAETMLPRIHFGWSELRSLVDTEHHYIAAPKPELYDLQTDPAEKQNILADERRVYAAMRQQLEQHQSAYAPPSPVDPEEAKKLAALGYLGQARSGGGEGELPDPKDRIADLEVLRRGSELEAARDFVAAAQLYRTLTEQRPAFADAWIRLAIVQDQMGDFEAARASYRAAIDAAPALAADLAISIAAVELRAGRVDDAKKNAELALTRAPSPARHLLGRIALRRGDLAGAENAARSVMGDPAYRVSGTVLLAHVLVAQGRLAEALGTMESVPREERTSVLDFEGTRGDILARLERFAEAEAAFRAEISRFPGNRDTYTKLALLLITTGRGREADAVLEALVRANPSRSSATLAAETWEVVGDRAAAAKWRARTKF